MSIEEVRALVAERQRYDDWLAALEAKRADTPSRVFDRVYGDYVGRRAEVITGLQSHVGELAAFGSELEQRLGTLETQLAAHEEELAEGMLRNLVGEYDDERWEAVRRAVEGKITALAGERDALQAEVEDVRTLLDSARVAPPAPDTVTAAADAAVSLAVASPSPAAPPPTEETPLVTPVDIDAVSAEVAGEVAEPEPAAPAAVPSVESVADVIPASFTPMAAEAVRVDDEVLLDIDVSGIVEHPAPEGASHEAVLADVAALFDTSSIAAVPESAPTAPVSQSEVDDALAMFGEVDGPADRQFVQSLQGIEADHERREDAHAATVTPPAAPGADDPFDDLAFLRSVIDRGGEAASSPAGAAAGGGEPQKTLRCTECGTMNLPTEWYCERCGGELAAF